MGNVHFFARPASSALLISGRRRTSIMISRSPIISIFSLSPAHDPLLYCCTIYTFPHQRFQHSSLCILPFGFFSSDCIASIHAQRRVYGRTTQAVPSGTPSFGIYHDYTWYIPCICRCPTYTGNIHGISMDIPCISIQVDTHCISMDIPSLSTQYIHGISMDIHVYTWYII
jgi:hypothetical protein